MLLRDKVGIITGAGSGIGRAGAVRLAKEGARLGLLDISESLLAETKRLVISEVPGAEVVCLQVDVSLEEQVRDAVASVTETFGKLNIAFNNAGVIMGGAKVGDVDTQRWEREIRINFFGAFYCAKYEILEMLKNGEPSSMVFTSSVGGLIGTPMGAAYCCAKAALIELAKVITCDYAARGIRANAICPGQIDTPMYRGLLRGSAGDNPEDVDDFIRRQNPQRRLGNPEEVAAAVAFLLSDEASHISGIALPVDGGHVATNLAYFLREYK